MKSTIIGAILALCIIPTCLAARDKGGIGPQTDFKSMSPEEVLSLLRGASQIKVCDKIAKRDRNSLERTVEGDCVGLARNDPRGGPGVLLLDMEALFQACGVYALAPELSWGAPRAGESCGLLGSAFLMIGNTAAARAVWEQAPGCHAHDENGNPTNGCVKYMLGFAEFGDWDWGRQESFSDHHAWPWVPFFTRLGPGDAKPDWEKLVAMARDACVNEDDVNSCRFLRNHGEQADWETAQREQSARVQQELGSMHQKQEQRAEKSKESNARFDAAMGTLQGMAASNGSSQGINTTSPGLAQSPSTPHVAASGSSSNGITETCPSVRAYPDAGASCNPVRIVNTCIRIVSNTWNPPSSTGGAGQLRVVYQNVCNFKVRLTAQPTGNMQGVNDTGELSNVNPGQQYAFTISTGNPPPTLVYQADDGVDCFGNIERSGCTNYPH